MYVDVYVPCGHFRAQDKHLRRYHYCYTLLPEPVCALGDVRQHLPQQRRRETQVAEALQEQICDACSQHIPPLQGRRRQEEIIKVYQRYMDGYNVKALDLGEVDDVPTTGHCSHSPGR